MSKSALLIIVFSLCFALFASSVLAAGFQLTRIGGLDVTGHQYSEWWYQGSNPTLQGTTTPSGTVEVAVNGTPQTVTADAAGAWSAPTTLGDGDHTLTLTSNGSTIAFTLHIGQALPTGVSAPAAPSQPVAGSLTPTLTLLGLGSAIILLGLRFAFAKRSA